MLGTRDKWIPVEVAQAYRDSMERNGCRCELKLYEGYEHGFFNRKDARPGETESPFMQSTRAMDDFLVSLGWLEPTSAFHGSSSVSDNVSTVSHDSSKADTPSVAPPSTSSSWEVEMRSALTDAVAKALHEDAEDPIAFVGRERS